MTSAQHKQGLLTIVNILSLDQLKDLRESSASCSSCGGFETCPKAYAARVTDTQEEQEAMDNDILAISQACHRLWPEHPASNIYGHDRCPCFRGVPPEEVLRTIDGAISLKKEIEAAKKNT